MRPASLKTPVRPTTIEEDPAVPEEESEEEDEAYESPTETAAARRPLQSSSDLKYVPEFRP